ncbi:MAG: DNA primase, partial [Hyphomicrobiaceae bacterium]
MKYPPHLLDDIRARISVSHVVSRKVALKRAGREYKGLSPFKVEKTPSFTVNDQKGFYHCFATGEHGDIFTFLMKTEGLSFPEAVEQLAAEAGVALPKPEPQDRQREDQRSRLLQLLETSAQFFQQALASGTGAEARRYAAGRGLARSTLDRFRIGFAPLSRTALKEHLAAAGFTVPEMITSGMLIGGDDIPSPYDRFRNRLMFPILDLKGRVIAFGGRALDKDAPAKYLNSPETPLFHKGAILYNAAGARPLAYDRKRIIVVEGYMDVVSLSEAGFGESVAPLGTALTEDQVQIVWRMVAEPTLCFDGDAAGKKAAWRAIDTILPNLKPGLSANFAFLPDGLDPDDLVRQQGREAMEAVLSRARPLADVLWEREFASGDWSTPERRARLEQQITALVGRIADPAVRSHYTQAMRDRFAEAWGQPWRSSRQRFQPGHHKGQPSGLRRVAERPQPNYRSPGRGGGGFEPPRAIASNSLRHSNLVEGEAARPPYREALLIRAIINHPWLLEDAAEEIAEIELASPGMQR